MSAYNRVCDVLSGVVIVSMSVFLIVVGDSSMYGWMLAGFWYGVAMYYRYGGAQQ